MDAFAPSMIEARPSLKPPSFRAAGIVTSAAFCSPPAFLPGRRRRSTQAQKYGKHYEGRVLSFLSSRFPGMRRSPWLSFASTKVSHRICQPDGLLFGCSDKDVTIIEVKARHTIDAYWQLCHLYRPVIQALFPDHTVRCLEIVKSFDGAVRFPEEYMFYFSFDMWQKSLPSLGVVQWIP